MKFIPVKSLIIIFAMLCALMAQAAAPLDKTQLDNWLVTTEALMPMQSDLQKMGKESNVAKKYTQDQIKALSTQKQDKLMDKMLKEQGIYQKVYQVLNKHDWHSAGDYMRISARLGNAIAAHMQALMTKDMPADQAKRVKELSGGEINANPQDVALINANWDRISRLLGKSMSAAKRPSR